MTHRDEPTSVSVVIPCYNQGRFLPGAIESALGQTGEPPKVIVVDDGSCDDTPSVAQQFSGVRYVWQENRGLSAARNRGLAECDTQYIVFLDADDLLLPNALRHGLECHAHHRDRAFVSGGYRLMDAAGNVTAEPTPADIDRGHFAALLRGNYIAMHATVMYRTEVVRDLGGFDESLSVCEDYDLYLRIADRHPIATHRHVVADYRIYPSTLSANSRRMYRTARHVLRRFSLDETSQPELVAARQEGCENWQRYYRERAIGAANTAMEQRKYWRGLEFAMQAITIDPVSTIRRVAARMTGGVAPAHERSTNANVRSWARLLDGEPISRDFGYDRGRPVDRYYIEQFLDRHHSDIRGCVLEVGDRHYTTRFGGGRVDRSEILHAHAGNASATYVCDLTDASDIPDNRFDCVILTQTLQLIYDTSRAVESVHRILRVGGVLLVTVPGITPISRDEWSKCWYWSFTDQSLRRVLGDIFGPQHVEVASLGNLAVATAFLQGLSCEDLPRLDFGAHDPQYPCIVTGRCVKE